MNAPARSLRFPLVCTCGKDAMVGPKGERYAVCLGCWQAEQKVVRECHPHRTRPSTGRCRCGAIRRERIEIGKPVLGPLGTPIGWGRIGRVFYWEAPHASPVD